MPEKSLYPDHIDEGEVPDEFDGLHSGPDEVDEYVHWWTDEETGKRIDIIAQYQEQFQYWELRKSVMIDGERYISFWGKKLDRNGPDNAPEYDQSMGRYVKRTKRPINGTESLPFRVLIAVFVALYTAKKALFGEPVRIESFHDGDWKPDSQGFWE